MITIGFSSHRAETLPFAVRMMEKFQVIVLEDPPYPNFVQMLDGNITREEYLMEIDSEFPEFESLMFNALKKLRKKGMEVLQIEPYLENSIR